MPTPRIPIEQRFWPKVDKSGDCWVWTASATKNGYGKIGAPGDTGWLLAHRVAYELTVGEIPHGLVLDHLCHNRRCVNPQHLEPVTQAINSMRQLGAILNESGLARTHCRNGHEWNAENVYLSAAQRRRYVCRPCRAIVRGAYSERKRAA